MKLLVLISYYFSLGGLSLSLWIWRVEFQLYLNWSFIVFEYTVPIIFYILKKRDLGWAKAHWNPFVIVIEHVALTTVSLVFCIHFAIGFYFPIIGLIGVFWNAVLMDTEKKDAILSGSS